MKFSKLIIPAVVLVAILVVLGYLFFPPGLKVSQRADIQLTISANGLDFTGSNGTGNCQSSTNPLCLRVPLDDDAEITFRLVGLPNWQFSRMQLSPVASAKPNFGSQLGFTPDMQADFYVKVNNVDIHPDTNGIIDLNGTSAEGREFILFDKNVLMQTYDYSLEVCPTTSSDPADCEPADPKIENEGSN